MHVVCVHSGSPLELSHQADVVTRPLGVRQTPILCSHFLLTRKFKQAERCERVLRVEDVVERAMEILGAVGENGLANDVDSVSLTLERLRV